METKLESLNIGGDLIILFDDIDSQVSYIMGLAESVSGKNVNFMTYFAKGLIYVCITKEQAKKLNLQIVEQEEQSYSSKSFTVSVDYKTNTTGISAFERSDTIKAFTQMETKPVDFKRPGHIFPLISKEMKMLERIGIAEVSVFIAEKKTEIPVAYVSEILNDKGEIANKNEVARLSQSYGLPIINFSEVAKYQYERTKWLNILDRKCLEDLDNILVYNIRNNYTNQQFKIFVRLGKNENINTIYYRECQFELLNSGHCTCKWHFKDYYTLLKNKDIDVIVFEHEHIQHSTSEDLMMEDIITTQINELIEEIFQMHREDMQVVVSNF